MLGNFARKRSLYATGVMETLDHDCLTRAEGVVIPHGLCDFKRNLGHLTLGFGHDTSELACDSLELWWQRHGEYAYPEAKSILLLCDGGGSNNPRHNIFKEDLQRHDNRIETAMSIRVAHYPAYCSKYNPIEHRLFPHVTRAWQSAVFYTLDLLTQLLKRVRTNTGLKVTVVVLKKVYQTKRQASDRFLESYPIRFDELLPVWNYTVVPTKY
ncbi:MAG: ISAzo13 family transposase [Pirellulaceae bacterium]